MGPMVWGKLAQRGPDALKGKKLIIWLMTTRDFYKYRDPWKQIPLQ